MFSYGHLYASGANAGNQVWGQGNVVSQLAAGVSVGPNGQFAGGRIMGSAFATDGQVGFSYGPWATGGGVHQGYVGFKFSIGGQTHFGWARVKVDFLQAWVRGVITGYAYETVANKAIVTGQTSGSDQALPASKSLGGLAKGSAH